MVCPFSKLLCTAVVLTFVVLGPTAVLSNPNIDTKWTTYAVNGSSAEALLNQMQRKGPNGYWAYTRWFVRWTANCKVSLEINYTMPRHMNREAMPSNLRAKWDRMVAALKAHEQKHGAHGISAARELVQKRCWNGNAIVQKWANQDVILDQRTNHGMTEGVVFP